MWTEIQVDELRQHLNYKIKKAEKEDVIWKILFVLVVIVFVLVCNYISFGSIF